MYQRKKLSEADLDRMRINLSVRSDKIGPEPCCDFCGDDTPRFIYAATKMSTGAWTENWRWCACEDCDKWIQTGTWGHIEDKMIAWLQKKFSVPNQVLRPVVRDSLSEFMLYAVKVKQQAGPC